MILMIDNYDSFTYNLVQYFGEFGYELLVKRNDAITLAEIEHLQPMMLVISPGPCTPNEAGASLTIIKHFAGKIPILGAIGWSNYVQGVGFIALIAMAISISCWVIFLKRNYKLRGI